MRIPYHLQVQRAHQSGLREYISRVMPGGYLDAILPNLLGAGTDC